MHSAHFHPPQSRPARQHLPALSQPMPETGILSGSNLPMAHSSLHPQEPPLQPAPLPAAVMLLISHQIPVMCLTVKIPPILLVMQEVPISKVTVQPPAGNYQPHFRCLQADLPRLPLMPSRLPPAQKFLPRKRRQVIMPIRLL